MITTQRRQDRPLEWFLAGLSIFWGVTALMTPGVVALSPVLLIAEDLGTPPMAALSMALGVIHMVALLVNGTATWTPFVRLLATASNAGLFAWIAMMALSASPLGPSAMNYAFFASGFMWCSWAAGQDVARMRLGTYGL